MFYMEDNFLLLTLWSFADNKSFQAKNNMSIYEYSIFFPHTSKARYELTLLHLWRVNVKTSPGFVYISLADFFINKTAP
jgi:hypothetical protein